MANTPARDSQHPYHQTANHVMGQAHPASITTGSYRSPYDWRYPQPEAASPYDPYHTVHQVIPEPTAIRPQKRSRGRIGMIGGAVAVAVVSGGVGAAAVAGQSGHSAALRTTVAEETPGTPAASHPAGSVEPVAAKVMPSVVKLQIDS